MLKVKKIRAVRFPIFFWKFLKAQEFSRIFIVSILIDFSRMNRYD
jgi:hypothetical protein